MVHRVTIFVSVYIGDGSNMVNLSGFSGINLKNMSL